MAAAAAAAASAATQAIAHSTLARYAVLCVGVALPLLFFALAVVRSQKFRRELRRDPFHVLHRGEDTIVAALGDDTNLKSLARALMHSLLLPLFAIAVLVVVADEFTERDLVSEVFDYAHQLLHIHPYVTTAAVVGVPSAITGMLHSIAQNASIAHGLSFQKHDVVDFPQLPGLSKPDASPPGLLVVDIEALDHHRVKLVRRCDELVVYIPLEEAKKLIVLVRFDSRHQTSGSPLANASAEAPLAAALGEGGMRGRRGVGKGAAAM